MLQALRFPRVSGFGELGEVVHARGVRRFRAVQFLLQTVKLFLRGVLRGRVARVRGNEHQFLHFLGDFIHKRPRCFRRSLRLGL